MSPLYNLANEYQKYAQVLYDKAEAEGDDDLRSQADQIHDLSSELRNLAMRHSLEKIQGSMGIMNTSTQKLQQEINRLNNVDQQVSKVAGWIDFGGKIGVAIATGNISALEPLLKRL
jgi:hypothetical protein